MLVPAPQGAPTAATAFRGVSLLAMVDDEMFSFEVTEGGSPSFSRRCSG